MGQHLIPADYNLLRVMTLNKFQPEHFKTLSPLRESVQTGVKGNKRADT
jgi:hypothetical protein